MKIKTMQTPKEIMDEFQDLCGTLSITHDSPSEGGIEKYFERYHAAKIAEQSKSYSPSYKHPLWSLRAAITILKEDEWEEDSACVTHLREVEEYILEINNNSKK